MDYFEIRRITGDHQRFREIVRGKVRKELKKYVNHGAFRARKGKNVVSVPIPGIDLPRFKFSEGEQGGVGSGEGEPGDDAGQPGEGEGAAGDRPGAHEYEVEITLEELARILGEELELPRIEPRGKSTTKAEKLHYSGIRRTGPESLRNFKRTYKAALRRQIASGEYDYDDPIVIPIRDDLRYRSWKDRPLPESKAVIIYMMDVSGSMGAEQKEIVRSEAFWIDAWLQSQYKDLDRRFIVHDAAAREVDEHTFFHLREAGGTKISSAYELAVEIIEEDYSIAEWNIYPFHFSDGDNWGGDDSSRCVKLLSEKLFPVANVFCYGQVKSAYGSGRFIKDLRDGFPDEEKLIISEINSREEIYDSIREFLGKGK